MRFLVLLPLLFLSSRISGLMTAHAVVPTECRGTGLMALTYNAGLAPGVVPLASPRIQAVAEGFAQFRDAGIACLQEAWTDEARDAIVAALDVPPERIYYERTEGLGEEPPGSNACAVSQIGPMADCVRQRCSRILDPEETTDCARRACRDELFSLHLRGGADCLDCLAASVGLGLEAIEARCTRPAPGATRAYGGRNGVLLVSRWPLKNRQAEMLPASYSNRIALYATVEVPGREPLEVACTHISTWNELPPALKDSGGSLVFRDWGEEMIRQVRIISSSLSRRARGRPQLFLGDMNAGPAFPPLIKATMPESWQEILALGFTSPAAQADRPFCSTCTGNSFRGPNAASYLIDHVLVRDPPGGSRLQPTCTQPRLVDRHRILAHGLGWVDRHLSDHRAVSVTFDYD